MKTVFVCSPFRGDVEGNTKLAQQLCLAAVKYGVAPFAPHLLYPQFLDESPGSRELGINAGTAILDELCEVWVYSKLGLTDGMKREIRIADSLNRPVRFDPACWAGIVKPAPSKLCEVEITARFPGSKPVTIKKQSREATLRVDYGIDRVLGQDLWWHGRHNGAETYRLDLAGVVK